MIDNFRKRRYKGFADDMSAFDIPCKYKSYTNPHFLTFECAKIVPFSFVKKCRKSIRV